MIETGVSYSANGWLHHFERDLDDIRAHHCTYIDTQMKCTIQICAPRNLVPHFWALGFGVPSGREQELETGFSLAVERGAQSVAIWGMHGNSAWDGSSENPQAVWDVVGKTYGKLRGIS